MQATCPYCKEEINGAAIKCAHCHEFIQHTNKEKPPNSKSALPDILNVVGRSFIPLTVLTLALVFKPAVDALLNRATGAEFMGTKLVFSELKSFSGKLTPVELYYLLGSAKQFGERLAITGYNLDVLTENGNIATLYSLRDKGLVELHESENSQEAANKGYGKRSINVRPTEKGKDFLVELGLILKDGKFVGAP
jgi:hypothetical protein